MKRSVGIIGLSVATVGAFLYFNPESQESLKKISKSFLSSITPSSSTPAPQPLSQKEVTKLVENNMYNFSHSVKQKDMSQFYENISTFWKKKTSVSQLTATFKPFIDSNIDLTVLDKMQPILNSTPTLTQNADLHVTGYYNTTPSQVHFKQTYYMQGSGDWKLAEFFIEVKKP